MRCSGHCRVTGYDLDALSKSLPAQYDARLIDGVFCLEPDPDQKTAIFAFDYGVVTFWGLNAEEEDRWLEKLDAFAQEQVDFPEYDIFNYIEAAVGRSPRGTIHLPDDKVASKLVASHALSQSVLLGVFERRVERTIAETEHVPALMAKTGRQPLSRRKLRRLVGHTYLQSSSINLHFDLLDEPEFLWEREDLEPLYTQLRRYLDIEDRITILNQKLQVLGDLLQVISDEIMHRHSSRLEWIIIWLIAVEVIFMLIHEMH